MLGEGCYTIREGREHMEKEELMLRQLTNQHLIRPTDGRKAAGDLCGLQAQYMSNAFHSLRLRSGSDSGQGLVKSWTIRGTMHVFPERDLPLFLHKGRSHYLRPCDTMEDDERIGKERKRRFAQLVLDSVAEGTGEREALKRRCFAAGMTEGEAESLFNPWGGMLRALCEEGKLCYKAQEKKEFMLCPPFEPMEEKEARLALARRYFTFYAPATIRDAAYFFGTTQTQVKAWLSELPVSQTQSGGKTYFYIETGREYRQEEIPDCFFLAGFDPLMLGYLKTESLYLPAEYLRGIFSLSGIVMPPLLLRGRVAGRWKRSGKRLLVTAFTPLSQEDRKAAADAAEQLWSGCELVFV